MPVELWTSLFAGYVQVARRSRAFCRNAALAQLGELKVFEDPSRLGWRITRPAFLLSSQLLDHLSALINLSRGHCGRDRDFLSGIGRFTRGRFGCWRLFVSLGRRVAGGLSVRVHRCILCRSREA